MIGTRVPVFIFGAVINSSLIVAMFIWEPNPDQALNSYFFIFTKIMIPNSHKFSLFAGNRICWEPFSIRLLEVANNILRLAPFHMGIRYIYINIDGSLSVTV